MKPPKRSRILDTSVGALLAILVLSPASSQAHDYTWTGAVDNNWETVGNWITNAPAGQKTPANDMQDADLTFTGSPRLTATYNNAAANTFIDSITYTGSAATFRLNGNSVNLDGGGYIANLSANPQVINFVNTVGFGGIQLNNFNFDAGVFVSSTHISAVGGDILIGSDITFGNPVDLILGGAHNIYLNGGMYNVGAGFGSLDVNGPGNVYLNGVATITGTTNVNGGKLYVNGFLGSLQTFVNPGGTLAGVGILGGNVVNSGNVAPGDAPGILNVKGTYSQSKLGTLTIEVAGNKVGQYSALAVQGPAALGGELRIVQVGNSPRLNVGNRLTVLASSAGVVGKFSTVDALPLEKVVYGKNVVLLEMSPFASVSGLTPNQVAVAKAVDFASIHGQQGNLVSVLQNDSVANLPGDLDRISPDQLTSIFTMGVALDNVQTMNLQRRMDDIRYGSHGFSASGFAAAGSGPLYSGGVGSAGPSGDDGKESKEMKEVAPTEDRWGVFITGVGEWVNVSGDDNARGYDITTGGFTVGADYKVTNNFAVGIDAGYAGTASDLTDHGRVFVNGGKLGLYSTYFTGGFYVDTAASGGYNSYDTRRSALDGTARGDTDGGELNVLLATGYDWKIGGFTIGPTASFHYTYVGFQDFNENGSLAPLNFPGQNQDSLRTAFGMKASYDWKLGGIVIKPELRAAWQHEFGDNTYSIDSTFDGASDDFRTSGPRVGRDSLLLGAGFAILWNERTSTYLYYDGELARTRYDENSVSGGVRVSF